MILIGGAMAFFPFEGEWLFLEGEEFRPSDLCVTLCALNSDP